MLANAGEPRSAPEVGFCEVWNVLPPAGRKGNDGALNGAIWNLPREIEEAPAYESGQLIELKETKEAKEAKPLVE